MHRLLLTLLAIGLGVLAFPPFHWHPLGLVALVPLLFALRDATPAQATFLGLLYGLGLYAGTLNWLSTLFGPMSIALFLMLALFPTFFASATASLCEDFESRKWLPFAIGILWTGLEHFRCEWFTLRFPWITPGTALPPGYLTPLVGVYGVSLLAATGAACLAFRQPRTGLALLALVALASYLPQPRSADGTLTLAAVQGESLAFSEYLELSRKTPGPVDAFVWPEYAVPTDIRRNPARMSAVRDLLADKQASFLTLGTRTDFNDGRWGNTAVTIGPDGVLGTHQKNRPVHFFDDGEPGTDTRAIETPLGRIATTICFDNDYAAIPRRAAKNGAELFLVPSMDAAHWSARQHRQHAELARHRAAENGRWFVVASSSGLTQAINPRGRRVAALPLFEPGVLVAKAGLAHRLTPYTRFGWLLGPTCTALTVVLLVLTSVLSRKERGLRSAKGGQAG
jgi:apolipoprotein N-acyltransferase